LVEGVDLVQIKRSDEVREVCGFEVERVEEKERSLAHHR
jgi:hypothetical protein